MARQPDNKQKTFDFSDRGSQLRWLDHAVLPQIENVAGGTLKGVLRAVDSLQQGKPRRTIWYEGAWHDMTYAMISRASGKSESQCRRALTVLHRRKLVNKERTGSGLFVQILWGNLDTFCTAAKSKTAEAKHEESAHHEHSERSPCALGARTMNTPSAHGEHSLLYTRSANPPTPESDGDDWQAVEEILSGNPWKMSPAKAQAIVELAREQNRTPDGMLHVIEIFQANYPAKLRSVGAIDYYLNNNNCWPADGVVDPRAVTAARESATRKYAAQRAKNAAAQAEHDNDRREWAALEAAYGAKLDALTPAQWDSLADEAFKGHPFTIEDARRGKHRIDLLQQFHKRYGEREQ